MAARDGLQPREDPVKTSSDAAGAEQKLSNNHGLAIFFMAVASFAAAATTRIMDAILPQIAQEFQVSVGQVAFVATAYALAYGGFQLVFGPLGDRYGKYRVILFACIGSALATYACAFATTLNGIAAARLASGMVAAAIVPLAIAWVGDVVPDDERQSVLARFMSGQIMGLLAGQIGGGVFGEFLGWRSAFFFIGSIYFVAIAGMAFVMLRSPRATAAPSGARPAHSTLATFARLLQSPKVQFVLLAVAIESFAMFGAFAYVGASLHLRYNLDFATIGLYLSVYCIGGLFYISQSKRLIQWLGPAGLCFWGSASVFAAYVGLAFAPHMYAYLPAIIVLGVGFYMVHNTLQTLATQMAPDARGSAVALFATSYFFAQAIGVYAAGQVLDAYGAAPVFLAAGVIMLILGMFSYRTLIAGND
jgi:MFS transporter, YNFM family, putative membrane transport protein